MVGAGGECKVAGPEELAAVLDFEDQYFPEWSQAFRRHAGDRLMARDADGTILGSLLLAGPGRVSTYWPLLGENCATIACVGVAPDQQSRGIGTAMVAEASQLLAARGAQSCLIDQVTRVGFYENLGYKPWRRYSMRRLTTSATPRCA